MRVRAKAVEQYRDALGQLGGQAAAFVTTTLAGAPEMDVADMRDYAIDAIASVIDVQGSVAQALAMQLYDAICMAEGIDSNPAVMFPDAIDRAMMVEKVHYYARDLVAGMRDKFDREAADLAEYYVRRCAYENTVRNCGINNVRYARVPMGGETCDFCMMLASRGFVYHSEATAKGEHGVHRACRCVVLPGKKGRTAIEGYDPDEWYAKWSGTGYENSSAARRAKRYEEMRKNWMNDEEAANLGKQWLKGVYSKSLSKDEALMQLAEASVNLDQTRNRLSPDAFNAIQSKIDRARFRLNFTREELRELAMQIISFM